MARALKEKFGEALDLKIYTNDSEEAKAYELRAPTTVFVDEKWVPLDIVISREKMEAFLKKQA